VLESALLADRFVAALRLDSLRFLLPLALRVRLATPAAAGSVAARLGTPALGRH
jgi:hypothetical protein